MVRFLTARLFITVLFLIDTNVTLLIYTCFVLIFGRGNLDSTEGLIAPFTCGYLFLIYFFLGLAISRNFLYAADPHVSIEEANEIGRETVSLPWVFDFH